MLSNQINKTHGMKLLALHYLVCSVRPNGIIYRHESIHSFYKNNLVGKISYNTFTQMYKLATQTGCFCKDEYSTRLINRKVLVEKLELPFYTVVNARNGKVYTNHRFMNKLIGFDVYKGLSYKQLLEKLYECIAIFNFIDQQRKINNNFFINYCGNQKITGEPAIIKRIIKQAAAKNQSFSEFTADMLRKSNKEIVTGSNHLAKKLNCGHTKANRILRGLSTKGLIDRKIITKQLIGINHHNCTSILESNKDKYVHYNKNDEFFITLGSSVKLSSKFGSEFGYYSVIIEKAAVQTHK
jgi:hypothetical protein